MPDPQMTPERYARAREIFSRARRLTGDERAALIARACGTDEALRHEIETLLAHADSPIETQALPEPLRRHAADLLRTAEAELALRDVPEVVDGYHIREVLGVGGMGAVFRAEQIEPVRRTVALKIIKLGMDSREIVARFASERQALALMDHPNVARVINAGATPDGRPYFVMEYVPGEPITDYCTAHAVDLHTRLTLFMTVCAAVQHAHQKGIIHRDLKASNILVIADGNTAVPKVIDFGIAKAIAQPLTPHATLTAVGRLVGTPEYMSPEQADSSGADVDTRADVYALGVLLYRLLCGALPFDSDTLRTAGLAGMACIIREQEPVRPSVRVATDDGAVDAARACGLERTALARTLRGDLDAITAKAMAKDRDLRYESAAALADDVGRYLANEPIRAQPPSISYRAWKLVRRHRAGVLAGIIATLGLIGAVAGIGVGYLRATTAEGRARAEADAAQSARREAETALQTARTATTRADAQAEALRRTLYSQQIALAQNAYQNDSVVRMRELLDATQPQRRGWEWEYLNWLSDRSRLTLRRHGRDVRCVAVSPDGATIITGGYDRRIIGWDSRTGAVRFDRTAHQHSVHCLACQPHGTLFASGSYDGTIQIWQLPEGKRLRRLTPDMGEVWSLAFSPDGQTLYSGGQTGSVCAWDAATGNLLFRVHPHAERVMGLAVTPDGERIITASADGNLRVCNAATGATLATWRGHTWRVNCVAVSPDGRYVVSGDDDKVILLRDADTGEILQTIRGHRAGILSIDFRPDGRNFVSASWDKTIKIWDTQTGRLLVTLPGHGNVVWAVHYSPDGHWLVSGGMDWTAKVWDADLGGDMLTLTGHSQEVHTLSWSPDGSRIASGGTDRCIHVWDTATGEELIHMPRHAAPLETVAFDLSGDSVYSLDTGGTVIQIDAKTGAERWQRNFIRCMPTDLGLTCFRPALSPNGLWLAYLDQDLVACLRNLHDGTITRFHEGISNRPVLVVISADGTRIASASAEHVLTMFDATTQTVLWTVRAHPYPIRAIRFNRDATQLASCSEDRSVKIWDVSTGGLIHVLTGHESGVTCADFSPDGTRLVTGGDDRTLKVWDTATGQEVLTLRGHDVGVLDVRFSPDGKRIASASADWTVRIWETGPPPGGFAPRGPVLEAQMLVFQHQDEHPSGAELRDWIAQRTDLTPEVQSAALRLVDHRHEDPYVLNARAWEVVKRPNAPAADYALALKRAAVAADCQPIVADFHTTHGAALYRNARFAEAIAALQRSLALRRQSDETPHPAELAFLAMAQHRSGTKADALVTLERLRMRMLDPRCLLNPDAQALLHEAVAVLRTQAVPAGDDVTPAASP